MADTPQDLLATARKERAQIAKCGVKDAAALQKKVDAGLGAIAAPVATYTQLLKDLAATQELQRRLDADRKSLAARVKASNGPVGAGRKALHEALGAVREARREAKTAGAALVRLDRAMADLGMVLGDYSPFQDLP